MQRAAQILRQAANENEGLDAEDVTGVAVPIVQTEPSSAVTAANLTLIRSDAALLARGHTRVFDESTGERPKAIILFGASGTGLVCAARSTYVTNITKLGKIL